MFTPEELKKQISNYPDEDLPNCDIQTLFEDPPSEATSLICRVPKSNFKSALHFFISLLESETLLFGIDYYQNMSDFLHLSKQECERIINSRINYKHVELNLGAYMNCIQLDNEWCNQSVLLETEDEFVFLYWFTSA